MKHLLPLLAFILAALACGRSAPPPEPTGMPAPSATPAAPTDSPVPLTDTPVPPTDTPEPTATPEPTETFTPTPDLFATAAFESTQAAEALLADVHADLKSVHVATDSGYLAWSGPEVIDLRMTSFNDAEWYPLDDGEEYENFVLRADITWESTSGLAICGFVFRGGQNISQDRYYLFQTIRLSGLPSWDVELWEYGQWQSTVSGTVRSAPAIDQANGATNTFILVADGGSLVVHANGTELGIVPVTSIPEGLIGYFAWSESGTTSCAFSNAWLWVIDR